MKHVLVTGGAGYIGSHASKALAAAGYVPVTHDTWFMVIAVLCGGGHLCMGN